MFGLEFGIGYVFELFCLYGEFTDKRDDGINERDEEFKDERDTEREDGPEDGREDGPEDERDTERDADLNEWDDGWVLEKYSIFEFFGTISYIYCGFDVKFEPEFV